MPLLGRPSPAATATIARDTYGMPYISSASERAGMYGFGYAQAEDRLVAILRNYKQAAGNLSEIDGRSALADDMKVRAFRLMDLASEGYQSLSPQVRADLDAFCAGINAYERDHPNRCPAWSYRVRPQHVVALSEFLNLMFANDQSEHFPHMSTSVLPRDLLQANENAVAPRCIGSNAFAVSPRSVQGGRGTIVSIDPHLPWLGILRWYQADLRCGALQVSGVTFTGLPYITMGHNADVAWANTVNAPDLSDIYEEHLLPGENPTRYEYDGHTKPLIRRHFAFRVKEVDGGFSTAMQDVVYTHHGPVLITLGGKHFAIRKAGWGDAHVLEQLRNEDLATSVAAYAQAVAGCHLVMFNHIVGDRSGHIGYIYGGRIPRRPQGYDFQGPVPGWIRDTEWQGILPLRDLPQVYDARCGFLENCNNSPQYVAPISPYNGKSFPIWLTPDTNTDRSRRLTELLSNATAMTPHSAEAIATDTLDLNARKYLPGLLSTVEATHSGETSGDSTLNAALKVLSAWDMHRTIGSEGPVVFDMWMRQLGARDISTLTPGDATAALHQAVQAIKKAGLEVDTPWGTVHRHRRGSVDLPMDGGGNCLVPNNGRPNEHGVITAGFGSSFQMIVVLGDGLVQAWSYLPYGESDDPASLHFVDQMPLAAERRYRLLNTRHTLNKILNCD